MKKLILLLAGFALLMTTACKNAGFKRTKSGLLYKIVSDGKGQKVKNHDFIKFHYVSKVHDSVMASTFGNIPAYAPVDSAVGPIYNPAEIFPMLRAGDSAVVVLLADSLRRKQGGLPSFIKRKDKLVFTFKVLSILPDESSVQKDQMEIVNSIKSQEEKSLQDYLTKHNIQAQKTEKGTFVVVQNAGDGMAADSGKLVKVKYTGRTLDGKVFDSNQDSAFGHTNPYSIIIYGSPAIEGWHDGLRSFKKGGKGQLYIPSMLAYGPNPPQGSKIKPFENLVFDVEIIDVTDAPQRTVQPPRGVRDSAGVNKPSKK